MSVFKKLNEFFQGKGAKRENLATDQESLVIISNLFWKKKKKKRRRAKRDRIKNQEDDALLLELLGRGRNRSNFLPQSIFAIVSC